MEQAIVTGDGARVCERMIEAQGGDPRVVSDPSLLPRAEQVVDVLAPRAGVVHGIDALEIGLTAVAMGAGRSRADQAVDHAVGIELACQRGDRVQAGQPLARLHVHRVDDAAGPAQRVQQAFSFGDEPVERSAGVLGRVEAG
jgi:pyrimidine-nucleoside phosphorylase